MDIDQTLQLWQSIDQRCIWSWTLRPKAHSKMLLNHHWYLDMLYLTVHHAFEKSSIMGHHE